MVLARLRKVQRPEPLRHPPPQADARMESVDIVGCPRPIGFLLVEFPAFLVVLHS